MFNIWTAVVTNIGDFDMIQHLNLKINGTVSKPVKQSQTYLSCSSISSKSKSVTVSCTISSATTTPARATDCSLSFCNWISLSFLSASSRSCCASRAVLSAACLCLETSHTMWPLTQNVHVRQSNPKTSHIARNCSTRPWHKSHLKLSEKHVWPTGAFHGGRLSRFETSEVDLRWHMKN